LVTIGSGVSEGAGVEFPTFPLTCVVVLKTLWHYRASVWSWWTVTREISRQVLTDVLTSAVVNETFINICKAIYQELTAVSTSVSK